MSDELSQIVKFVIPLSWSVHGKGKQSVSVVENGSGSGNLVCVIVDKIAEITHVPIGVENQRIEEKDIGETRISQCLVAGNKPSGGNKAILLAGE